MQRGADAENAQRLTSGGIRNAFAGAICYGQGASGALASGYIGSTGGAFQTWHPYLYDIERQWFQCDKRCAACGRIFRSRSIENRAKCSSCEGVK